MNDDQVANNEVQAPTENAQSSLPHVPGDEAYLNPCLHAALVRRFGTVYVTNKGKSMLVETAIFNGQPAPSVRDPGETYKICCPWCHDSKCDLSVPHGFGTLHEDTGRRIYFARCFSCGKAGKDLFKLMGRKCKGHITPTTGTPVIQAQPDNS